MLELMLELRDYQEALAEKCRAAFRAGHRAIMLYAPTGAGKTEIAISLLEATAKKENRAAMILDRIILCEQTSTRLEKYKISHGVLQSGHWRYRPAEKIQICSAQTLEKRGSLPDMKLLIVDEAHTQRAGTKEFIKNSNVLTIGLSASPFTKGLGDTYKHVVSAVTTRELVDRGSLVGLRVFIAHQIEMDGAKKAMGEWTTKEATERGVKITGDIVAEWIKKTHEIYGEPRKTIIFAAGVAHGQDLAEKFAQAGYNFISISYKDDDQFKQDAIKDFARSDTSIHGLIATDILTKGFDQSDVMIGISARPFSKSFASHVQQLGRVMRPHEGKEFATWLDHSGNYLRFKDQWDELYSGGVTELDDNAEKTKKEPTDKEKEAAKCPRCGALVIGNSDTCAHCGFTRPRRNEVKEVAGEMAELSNDLSKEKFSKEIKQDWYSQLICHAKSKGYNSGWCAHKYRDKFGVWPKGMKEVHKQPTSEVLNYLVSRAIAYSKTKK